MRREPNDRPSADAPISEQALIAEFWVPLAADFPGAFSLKDDCATIACPPGGELVVTTDGLIAGVHFLPGEDAFSVGWKALAVNVSDLTAKGATPLAYLMSVALPEAPERAWLARFAEGLAAAQHAFGCHLAGGDTDRTPGPLSVTITAFGVVPAGRMVRRGGGRPGDHVYVSGTIGDAALGLALKRDTDTRARWGLDDKAYRYLEGRFSRPRPPTALAPVLLACASAAMDVSDGLVKDFGSLCGAAGLGGQIEAARVPLSEAARLVIASGGASLADLVTGGEDYEVLAAVPADRVEAFEQLAATADTRVTRIGVVEPNAAGIVMLDDAGTAMTFERRGWDHFDQRV
ncbi:MAG: thiamine-phosphate kinase [Hyphomicrobium sp.]|jgi:thiamine-monophosphate kinase